MLATLPQPAPSTPAPPEADAAALLRGALTALTSMVPCAGAVLSEVDPSSLLWTGAVVRGLPEAAPADLDLAAEARALRRLDTRRAVSEPVDAGPLGGGPCLRVRLVADGRTYGAGLLVRAPGEPGFTVADEALVATIAYPAGHALRGSLGRTHAEARPGGAAGELVLDAAGAVVAATGPAPALLLELGATLDTPLPTAVHAVAAAARDGAPTGARARTASGHWLALSGAARPGGTVAVRLEHAGPADVVPLAAEGRGLCSRQRDVLTLLLAAVPERAIAGALWLSPDVAEDHVVAVLRSFGVASPQDLRALLLNS